MANRVGIGMIADMPRLILVKVMIFPGKRPEKAVFDKKPRCVEEGAASVEEKNGL